MRAVEKSWDATIFPQCPRPGKEMPVYKFQLLRALTSPRKGSQVSKIFYMRREQCQKINQSESFNGPL